MPRAPATDRRCRWLPRARFGRATSNSRSSGVLSRSTPGHQRPSEFRFVRSTGRQVIVCASSWSTRSHANPVEGEDRGRGYEYAKNTYIPIGDDELDAIAIESTHTIEIDSFVPREQIDQRYLDSLYYITPDNRAGREAFAVVREAMRAKSVRAGKPRAGHRDRALA